MLDSHLEHPPSALSRLGMKEDGQQLGGCSPQGACRALNAALGVAVQRVCLLLQSVLMLIRSLEAVPQILCVAHQHRQCAPACRQKHRLLNSPLYMALTCARGVAWCRAAGRAALVLTWECIRGTDLGWRRVAAGRSPLHAHCTCTAGGPSKYTTFRHPSQP